MKKVGDSIEALESSWTFDGSVCITFDDHIKKSVPLYDEGHKLITLIAKFFLKDKSICYDIGSSTGTLVSNLSATINKDVKYVAVEPSCGMHNYATEKHKNNTALCFINGDINDIELENSDLILCYYTMQFIQQKNRQNVVRKIYNSLNVGGAFIIFEKARAEVPKINDILNQVYIDFKTSNGYSDEEILTKQRSLVGVMDSNTSQENIALLENTGFKKISIISKYMQFEGILAIK